MATLEAQRVTFDIVKAAASALFGLVAAVAAFVAAQVDVSSVIDNAERLVGGGVILTAGALLFRWLLLGYGGLVNELQEENKRLIQRVEGLEAANAVLRGELPDRREGKS